MEIFKLFGTIFLRDEEAQRSLTNMDRQAEGVNGKFSNMIGTIGKWGLAVGAAAGTAALALGVKAFNATEDLHKALNGLQASTGVTKDEMQGMNDALLDIYNNNFGESFEDIAKQMSVINQQSGLTGDELKNTTKNALLLRDTFDFDVNESFRAANMLMQQFGLNSTEAYNLIAQGAQYGLDKNGDLLDTINEYSVHFKSVGLDAESMFNALANGAFSGTFSVDKLGDAIKEFGIRTKDESKTTTEAFKTLGLNVQQVSMDFAKGGESGKAAFELVTSKIFEMQDPLKQNQVGVALFGTQWEDLGVKGVQALTDVYGGITKDIDALNEINAIKYDTVGEAITGIGRNLETGILIPLGEKILPILNRFANWISENIPIVVNSISEVGDIFETYVTPVINVFADTIKYVSDVVLQWVNDNEEMLTKMQSDFESIFKSIQEVVTVIINVLTKLWKQYGDDIVNVLKAAWDTISTIFSVALTLISDVFKIWAAVFKGDWAAAWNGIKQLFNDAWDGIGKILDKYIGYIKSVISTAGQVLTDAWNGIWTGIKNTVVGIFDSIISSIKSKINVVIGFMNKFVNSTNNVIGKLNATPGVNLPTVPNIPMLANGGNIVGSGSVLVGERGPEILDLPTGARVTPLDKTGGITVNINSPTLFNDRDADRLGQMIVGRLRTLGVN